jgi:tetratricopeptide (TPR) repeat protein
MLAERLPINKDVFARKKKDWRDKRSISFAADLVASGVALGQESDVREAAEFLLSAGAGRSASAKALALRALGLDRTEESTADQLEAQEFKSDVQSKIHDLRVQLHEEPRNALLWTNLSRLYTNLGCSQQATRAIEMAMRLAPVNRFVLRSAARLFVHQDDYGRAHDILRHNERVKHDPWLLSAEIAVAGAARRRSLLVKRGKRILDSDRFSVFDVSELASALSTLDFEAGNVRHGRQHLKKSLKEPTENSVAQAGWLERQFFGVSVKQADQNWPTSHEALAWECCRKAKWKETICESLKWLYDQPFSSRPSVLGSYIAAVPMGAYEESARIAQQGLIANPKDFTLLNNFAFALGHMGKVQKARELFGRISPSSLSAEERFVWLATNGFLYYREGHPMEGRKIYMEALEEQGKRTDEKRRASAFLWMTMEELRIGSARALEYKRQALELKKLPYPDLLALIKRLQKA